MRVLHSTIINGINGASADLKMPEITGDLVEIEFDEMWHFIGAKKVKNGSSKPLIVAQGRLLPGLQATVILKRLECFTIKSSI